MADRKTVRDEAPPIHEAGQFAAVCVDVIDLGLRVESYPGQDSRLVDKTALVFRTEDDGQGKPRYISQEFSTSMGKKSNLRKFLEAWRGRAYTEDEARKQGVPLDKLEGQAALLTVAHKVSGKGNEYAHILTVAPLPRQMRDAAPTTEGYERPEFWAKRKAEYAEGALKHTGNGKSAAGASNGNDFSDYPESMHESDDDLPF